MIFSPAWFRSKSPQAHSLLGLMGSLALYIASSHDAQQFLITLLAGHPGVAAAIISLAVSAAGYMHSSSPAGTLATARDIKDSGNAPTAAQVDAASTK